MNSKLLIWAAVGAAAYALWRLSAAVKKPGLVSTPAKAEHTDPAIDPWDLRFYRTPAGQMPVVGDAMPTTGSVIDIPDWSRLPL